MTVTMGYEVLLLMFFKHIHRRWYFGGVDERICGLLFYTVLIFELSSSCEFNSINVILAMMV